MASPILLLETYREGLKAGSPPVRPHLRKQFVADQVKAAGNRKLTFTISTGAVDRDRDTLKVDGWRLDNYRKNPVVLWAHDSRGLPIGRAASILTGSGALKATAEFADAETYPFADTVYRMLEGGFLRATSVGFVPIKGLWNDERMGIDFEEQELLEFSVVPVPANPEALLDAKAAGIELAPLKAWAEGVLDGFEPGQWLSKEDVARALKALSAPAVAGFDPQPYLDAFEKRGRALSAANEERIRTARDAGAAIGAVLDEVLASVPAEEPEPEKSAPLMPFVLVKPEPKFLVVPEAVKAAMAAAVSSVVTAKINFARGRID